MQYVLDSHSELMPELGRKDAAIAELVQILKACASRLEFANKHIDCEDEIAIANAAIAKYDK